MRSVLRRRWIVLLALVPVIPVLAAVLLDGGTSSGTPRAPFSPSDAGAALPPARSPSEIPPGPGALVALVTHPTAMRDRPGGKSLATLGLRTVFGTRQAVWVVSRSGSWLGVLSPQLGNGRTGWISLKAVRLFRDPWEIKVSLSARSLTVLDAGRVVARDTVAIGQPAAPTPTGRFDVTDRLTTGDPSGPYGCCVVALSAVSPHAIQGWSGGNRIAIHSTTETSTIGEPVSHGCIRLTLPEGQWLLDHIPVGTPTLISA